MSSSSLLLVLVLGGVRPSWRYHELLAKVDELKQLAALVIVAVLLGQKVGDEIEAPGAHR